MSRIQETWYRRSWLTLCLYPLHLLYLGLTSLRRLAYAKGLLSKFKLSAPVIVVGNIAIGGTGKTPFVQALVRAFQSRGIRCGIISRGYGAKRTAFPHAIDLNHDCAESVGDEPYLLAKSLGVPVVIDPKRARAGEYLLQEHEVDVVITDDGLQHYALQRDYEIVVVDGIRIFGNGLCLPAGPLRELPSRLKSVDLTITNGESSFQGDGKMLLSPQCFRHVSDRKQQLPLEAFAGKTVHVFAGIGNPERFYRQLKALDLVVTAHSVADHHHYQLIDFTACEGTIIMTEKDAVKCAPFNLVDAWYLEVTPNLDEPKVFDKIIQQLKLG